MDTANENVDCRGDSDFGRMGDLPCRAELRVEEALKDSCVLLTGATGIADHVIQLNAALKTMVCTGIGGHLEDGTDEDFTW
jgi:hypothetical protein